MLELHAMAMPIPEQMHDAPRPVTRNDERASEQPTSGTRAAPRRPGPGAAPTRMSPDEEAMMLMMKVVERVEVAKSFAKIAAGILTVSAARASVQLRAVADAKMAEAIEREGGLMTKVDRMRKIARAAKDAAVHVATHRRESESESESGPETQEAPGTLDAPVVQDIQP